MTRKSMPQPLTLPDGPDATTVIDEQERFIASPTSPLSPKSPRSPRSPFRFNSSKRTQDDLPPMQVAEPLQSRANIPSSQSLSSIQILPSGQENQIQERPARGGFFSNYKASKGSGRLQNQDAVRPAPKEEGMSRDTDRPAMASKVSAKESGRTDPSANRTIARRPVGGPSRSNVSLDSQTDPSASTTSVGAKKHKPKPFSLLSRSRSLRDEKSPVGPSTNNLLNEPEEPYTQNQPVKTFGAMMNSSARQRSEDRQPPPSRDTSRGKESNRKENKESSRPKGSRENSRSQIPREQKEPKEPKPNFSSFRTESTGHSGFLANFKNQAAKNASALGKGLFGKGSRSGSTSEKEPVVDDEHYVLKVLNRPLVEQTRLTRISKRLEDSRDKTEFWMPAFPWRAIDYLNYKGSDVEGLYRVPGSGPQIKKWQRRFDEEYDVDLFEQDDLYDINIIGSMLKAWLRELPDELFPKASQDRIARECAGSETVPQLLVDELSNLSPFNYYLLFAITCHLSLLLAHSEKNKMDFRNLCICFQPCMKIDAFCFKFLVCDWRDCWKGCKTEAHYVEQEYMVFDMIAPSSAEGRSSTAVESQVESHEERNVSSSDSSKPSTVSIDNNHGNASKNKDRADGARADQGQREGQNRKLPPSQGKDMTAEQQTTPPRRNAVMRPLSPIKPLSPIGF